MTLLAGDGLVVRALAGDDVPLLARWRADERIETWWEGPTDEAGVRAKYVGNAERAHITHAVAERDGVPVGYVQWYAAPEVGGVGAWAVDVHVDPDLIGSGVGSRLVRLVARHLRATVAERVVIDPAPHNARAIRAYEKAGFVALRETPEALVMVLADGTPERAYCASRDGGDGE